MSGTCSEYEEELEEEFKEKEPNRYITFDDEEEDEEEDYEDEEEDEEEDYEDEEGGYSIGAIIIFITIF